MCSTGPLTATPPPPLPPPPHPDYACFPRPVCPPAPRYDAPLPVLSPEVLPPAPSPAEAVLNMDLILDPEVDESLLAMEKLTMPSVSNMSQQPEIRWEYRGALIDYIVSLHGQLRLCQDSLYLAVNMMDRYLSTRVVHIHSLQMLVVTCLWIAAKLEEVKYRVPRLDDLVHACNFAYDKADLKRMEVEVLGTLNYSLRYPSPGLFIHRHTLRAGDSLLVTHLACYLAEMTLYDSSFLYFCPSTIAQSCLSFARSLLGASRPQPLDSLASSCETILREKLPSVSPNLHAKYASPRFSEASIIAGYCTSYASPMSSTVSSGTSPCSSPALSLASVSSAGLSPISARRLDYKENLADFYEQCINHSSPVMGLSIPHVSLNFSPPSAQCLSDLDPSTQGHQLGQPLTTVQTLVSLPCAAEGDPVIGAGVPQTTPSESASSDASTVGPRPHYPPMNASGADQAGSIYPHPCSYGYAPPPMAFAPQPYPYPMMAYVPVPFNGPPPLPPPGPAMYPPPPPLPGMFAPYPVGQFPSEYGGMTVGPCPMYSTWCSPHSGPPNSDSSISSAATLFPSYAPTPTTLVSQPENTMSSHPPPGYSQAVPNPGPKAPPVYYPNYA
ncbi:G2/mitotic-specific cyclin [Dimargaris verticillata]|uniref:G2/mitotic-specific cyclin n=1 Tax=Dimargaris verticillata TaxID=2761393 RepID=A0A9W8B0Z9_9FUNG|nr:G2/mitotic-specific cyclin [Dimargaris verticillata]